MRAAIALNRFGLGAKPSDRVPDDPRGWLLDQLRGYDPRPPAIVAAMSSSEFFESFDEYRQARRARGQPDADAAMNDEGQMRDREERRGRRQPRRADEDDPAMEEEDPLDAVPRGRRNGRDPVLGLPGRLERSTTQARLAAAVATDAPFPEHLVHFWSNHFAISGDTVVLRSLAGAYEFDAIRPHVLGRFADMLKASVNHAAMLVYLNQNASIGPNSPVGRRSADRERQRGLNENLGREILELHTLGVRSGYTEEDVRELSRALTGRTVGGRGPGRNHARAGEAVYVENMHEPGARTLLGRGFPDTGEEQAAAMLDFVAARPETARHIATKLARHFIADEPPASAVARIERAFVDSEGDLPTVYRALVESPEAWADPFPKFKTPWEWLVSSWRAAGPDVAMSQARQVLNTLGQPVWKPESPAGFDDVSESWVAPDALMRRVEMAQEIVRRMPDQTQPVRLAEQVLPGVLSDATRTAISRADSPAQGLTMLLVAPEFLRR